MPARGWLPRLILTVPRVLAAAQVVGGAFSAEPPAADGHPRRPSLAAAGCDAGQAGVPLRCSYRRRQRGATRGGPLLVSATLAPQLGPGSRPGRSKPRHFVVGPSVATEAAALGDDLAPWWWTHKTGLRRRRGSASRSRTTAAPSAARARRGPTQRRRPPLAGLTPTRVFLTPRGPPPAAVVGRCWWTHRPPPRAVPANTTSAPAAAY